MRDVSAEINITSSTLEVIGLAVDSFTAKVRLIS